MGNTLYMFAQASSGEDDSRSNGELGDQSGIELNCRPWFQNSPPWGKVYRIKDAQTADAIATVMERLVANGWIGYKSAARNSMKNRLNEIGGDINALVTPCATDCSALAYYAVMSVTGVVYDGQEEYMDELAGAPDGWVAGGSPIVRNLDHYFEVQLPAAGFEVEVYTIPNPEGWRAGDPCYTSSHDVSGTNLTVSVDAENWSEWLNHNKNLRRGDIVRTITPHNSGHVVVWV